MTVQESEHLGRLVLSRFRLEVNEIEQRAA